MPTYVGLLNWTEQGVKGAKDTVDRYEAAREAFAEMGITLREALWTTGAYDLVAIADAPDDETMAAAMLALAGAGNIRTTTMRAFTADEMRRVIAKIPG
jgi:uncharacterized protein with GYD domain